MRQTMTSGQRWLAAALLGAWTAGGAAHASTAINFEDVGATLAAGQRWSGAGQTAFDSGGAHFAYYQGPWSWGGWIYTKGNDTQTRGFTNDYSAITGGGAGGSATYAMGYVNAFDNVAPTLTLAQPHQLAGAYFTNGTYPYWSMVDGDQFSTKFGGPDGNALDWFRLTVTGYNGATVTGTVDVPLADFTSPDNAQDYVLDTWKWVDLSGLKKVDRLVMTLTSSDTDPIYGMNTPAYFAMDDLTLAPPVAAVPEPMGLVVWVLLAVLAAACISLRRSRFAAGLRDAPLR